MKCPALFARRGTMWLALSVACLSPLALAGCSRSQPAASNSPAAAHQTPAATPSRAYTPVFARREAAAAGQKRGTLGDDFQWAAGADTLEEAAARWEDFLKTHAPAGAAGAAGEEYEDAFQANHVSSARYELMRVYYLLGRAGDGDRLLRELDPLSLSN
ncbi:MAG TPA: hypothetical protein VF240_04535 [Pyrinomonadaceae bacterium]